MSDSKAKINEKITCVAKSPNHGQVTGISGAYGYNISVLKQWGSGNFHGGGQGQINSRDARRFSNAVRDAEDEHLIGKRSAFSCAEVNAVTRLLYVGASLSEITVYSAKGSDGRFVNTCDACQHWMDIIWG